MESCSGDGRGFWLLLLGMYDFARPDILSVSCNMSENKYSYYSKLAQMTSHMLPTWQHHLFIVVYGTSPTKCMKQAYNTKIHYTETKEI